MIKIGLLSVIRPTVYMRHIMMRLAQSHGIGTTNCNVYNVIVGVGCVIWVLGELMDGGGGSIVGGTGSTFEVWVGFFLLSVSVDGFPC